MHKLIFLSIVMILCFSGCRSNKEESKITTDSVSGNKQIPPQNTAETELKKRELDLKEKELALKEKELETRNKPTDINSGNSSRYPGKFPETSMRKLDRVQVENLAPSKYEKKIMRNEIFARHGYIFKTDDMRNYFSSQSWYIPQYENVNSFLTSIEKYNAELIKYAETGAE